MRNDGLVPFENYFAITNFAVQRAPKSGKKRTYKTANQQTRDDANDQVQ